MDVLEVFADIACPFTHVGLRRFVATRIALGRDQPVLRVRAWPLELVNGSALRGSDMEPKIRALRRSVASDCFRAFTPDTFPSSTLPALASSAAAYRLGPERGEEFSLAVRDALFEGGKDVSDPTVLADLQTGLRVGDPTEADAASVEDRLPRGHDPRRRRLAALLYGRRRLLLPVTIDRKGRRCALDHVR